MYPKPRTKICRTSTSDSKSDNNSRGDINAYYRFVLYGLAEFNITMSIDVRERYLQKLVMHPGRESEKSKKKFLQQTNTFFQST